MTAAAAVVWCASAGLNVASLALLGWVRRERRRLEDLRFGVAGGAFNERRRDEATARLRP